MRMNKPGYNVFVTGNPLAQSRPLSFYWQLLVSQFGWVGVAVGLVGLLASTENLARQWSSRTCSAPAKRKTGFATPEENSYSIKLFDFCLGTLYRQPDGKGRASAYFAFHINGGSVLQKERFDPPQPKA